MKPYQNHLQTTILLNKKDISRKPVFRSSAIFPVCLSKEINDYVFTAKLYNSRGNTQYDYFGSNRNQNHDDYFYNFGFKKFINDDIFV